ncbi:MAG TPA: hypothetical protein VHW65_13565 [Gemmatimonadales bacterium]|jgi:hypothetical protein|nr:hypothetical protein [Gemmatimonadales bacterium]
MTIAPQLEQIMIPEELVAALKAEERLLRELGTALGRQRAGVAADDPTAIEMATHTISRIVLTLEEARRRRERLMQLGNGGMPASLEQLDATAGAADGLAAARLALRDAAVATVRDLTINQKILRGALRAGDAYLQALFSSVSEALPAYSPAAILPERTTARGVVVNRNA